MDQVSDNIVKIILDMRLLDQYRVRYNKHANADDLVKILVEKIDSLLKIFLSTKKVSRSYYEKLGNIKIRFHLRDDRNRSYGGSENKKEEITININSIESEKIISLSNVRSKIFEDSLFGDAKGNKTNEAFIKNNSDINGNDKSILRNKRGKSFKRKPKKRRKF